MASPKRLGALLPIYTACIVLMWMHENVVMCASALKSVKVKDIPGKDFDGFQLDEDDTHFLGDVNGDGIDDFMSVEWESSIHEPSQPKSKIGHVFLGRSLPFPKKLLLNRHTDWFLLMENVTAPGCGYASPGPFKLGDVNGDAIDDVMLSGNGSISILYGTEEDNRTVNMNALDGNNGFTIRSLNTSGLQATGCGDFNNDGFNDIVATNYCSSLDRQPYQEPFKTYVVFGKLTRQEAVLDISNLEGADGLEIENFEGASKVYAVGDINGDRFNDVSTYDGSIVYGTSSESHFDRSTLRSTRIINDDGAGTNRKCPGGHRQGSHCSLLVQGIGDFNGDTLDDILAAFPAVNGFTVVKTAIIFGNESGLPEVLNITELDGSNGFIINNSYSGVGIGDFNGDRCDDIFVWPIYTSRKHYRYLLFGNSGPFPASVELSAPETGNMSALVFKGLNQSHQIEPLGDVNDDGAADVLLGGNLHNTTHWPSPLPTAVPSSVLPPIVLLGGGNQSDGEPGKHSSGLGAGAIVGIFFACLVVAAVVLGIVLYKYRTQKNTRKLPPPVDWYPKH